MQVSACLPIQEETKQALFKLLHETASQTKKTLISAEERVTTTEKIYETTKAMIDKYKTRSTNLTTSVRDKANTLVKLRKGIKRHCVSECGECKLSFLCCCLSLLLLFDLLQVIRIGFLEISY